MQFVSIRENAKQHSSQSISQKGAKKFLERYGESWFAFDESGWSSPEKPEIVGLRVEFQETELQRRVKQAGGKWNSKQRSGKLTMPRPWRLV